MSLPPIITEDDFAREAEALARPGATPNPTQAEYIRILLRILRGGARPLPDDAAMQLIFAMACYIVEGADAPFTAEEACRLAREGRLPTLQHVRPRLHVVADATATTGEA